MYRDVMLLYVLYMFEIWHTKIIGQQHQTVAAKFKDLNISENEYGKIEQKHLANNIFSM